jgi:hypothetical protein
MTKNYKLIYHKKELKLISKVSHANSKSGINSCFYFYLFNAATRFIFQTHRIISGFNISCLIISVKLNYPVRHFSPIFMVFINKNNKLQSENSNK